MILFFTFTHHDSMTLPHHETLSAFVADNADNIHASLMQRILSHPEKGELSSYAISKGKMYPEQQSTFDRLFMNSIYKVAEQQGIELKDLAESS